MYSLGVKIMLNYCVCAGSLVAGIPEAIHVQASAGATPLLHSLWCISVATAATLANDF